MQEWNMAGRDTTIPLEPGSDGGEGVHSKADAAGLASTRRHDR